MEKKTANYIEKALERNKQPILSDEEIEKEIGKCLERIEKEYDKILFLTIEKEVGCKITVLPTGGAIISGKLYTKDKFADWLDDTVVEYELDKPEEQRTRYKERYYEA